MGLCDRVRENAAAIAARARHVRVDLDRVGQIEPGQAPLLDPERHYLDGSRENVAAYLLTLDAINFGSGWFPTLRKRPGCSGYYTVGWALADQWRAHGPWSNDQLRAMDADALARVLGQERGHELIGLYTEALRQLGQWLGDVRPLERIEHAAGGAPRALPGGLRAGAVFCDGRVLEGAQNPGQHLPPAGPRGVGGHEPPAD